MRATGAAMLQSSLVCRDLGNAHQVRSVDASAAGLLYYSYRIGQHRR